MVRRKQGALYNFRLTAEDRAAIIAAAETLTLEGRHVANIHVVAQLLRILAADMESNPVTAQERLELPEVNSKDPQVGGVIPTDLVEQIPRLVKIAGVPGANSLVMLARRRYLPWIPDHRDGGGVVNIERLLEFAQ